MQFFLSPIVGALAPLIACNFFVSVNLAVALVLLGKLLVCPLIDVRVYEFLVPYGDLSLLDRSPGV